MAFDIYYSYKNIMDHFQNTPHHMGIIYNLENIHYLFQGIFQRILKLK
jgi:hypothetical protein